MMIRPCCNCSSRAMITWLALQSEDASMLIGIEIVALQNGNYM